MLILDDEGIKYDNGVLAELIMKYMPDWRRVINELQRYSTSGVIDSGILVSLNDVSVNELMSSLKIKDFIKSEIQKHSTKKKENHYTTA